MKTTHLTLKNALVPLHFVLWNGSRKPIQQVITRSFWLWGKAIYMKTVFWLNQRRADRDAKSTAVAIL